MICNTIGLTADSYQSIYLSGGDEVAEVYGGLNYAQPIFYKSQTLTGTAPLYFDAYPEALTDYTILGNSYQDGTPTPEAPVDVVGCGDRTENLFDGYLESGSFKADTGTDWPSTTGCRTNYIGVTQDKTYTVSVPIDCYARFVAFYGDNKAFLGYKSNTIVKKEVYTFDTPYSTKTIRIVFAYKNESSVIVSEFPSDEIMLNEGSTALPHGFKLPLTVNGTEYPIYLGQMPTTRRIKKLVLTGGENFTKKDINGIRRFITSISPAGANGSVTPLYCSHFIYGYDFVLNHAYFTQPIGTSLFINRKITESITDFKSFLAAEYSAGHPVTIWYVLAEPETAVVNEPLMKIGDYADTISMAQAGVTFTTTAGSNTFTVGATVQPSAVSITGNIKPTGYGQLLDVNDVDIQDSNSTPIFVHE